MPLYEYECSKCKHHFELLQKFSDKPAKVCVRCGAPAQRLISSPSIKFKGTGWYVTDYGKGGTTSAGKDNKPANADSAKEKAPASTPAASESNKSKDSASPSTSNPKS